LVTDTGARRVRFPARPRARHAELSRDRGDLDAGDDGDGAVVFLIYISAAWLRLDLVAVYFRRTFTGLRNRVGFNGATSFAAVLSGSVESAR
jgi:hypothetical protein